MRSEDKMGIFQILCIFLVMSCLENVSKWIRIRLKHLKVQKNDLKNLDDTVWANLNVKIKNKFTS